MKSVEFLYFYLMPETPYGEEAQGERANTRTTGEKQAFLGKYLSNVEDLVEDLRESAPFGTAVR